MKEREKETNLCKYCTINLLCIEICQYRSLPKQVRQVLRQIEMKERKQKREKKKERKRKKKRRKEEKKKEESTKKSKSRRLKFDCRRSNDRGSRSTTSLSPFDREIDH